MLVSSVFTFHVVTAEEEETVTEEVTETVTDETTEDEETVFSETEQEKLFMEDETKDFYVEPAEGTYETEATGVTCNSSACTIPHDSSLITKIGAQVPSHCSDYSMSYAKSIIDGFLWNSVTGYFYDESVPGAKWSNAGFTSVNLSGYSETDYVKKVISELQAGRPVIIKLKEGTYRSGWSATPQHYVCAYGYKASTNTSSPKLSDLYVYDPGDATGVNVYDGFVHSDRQIVYTTNTQSTNGYPGTLSVSWFEYLTYKKNGQGICPSGFIFTNGSLTSVKYYVKNSSGTAVFTASATPNTNFFNLTKFDPDVSFKGLANGTYTLCLDIADSLGQKINKSYSFTVGSGDTSITAVPKIVCDNATTYNSITVTDFTYPTHKHTAVSGSGEGYFTIRGYLYSPTNITSVNLYVADSNGNRKFGHTVTPNATFYDLNLGDSDMSFNSLAAGNYTIYLVAKNTLNQYINLNSNFTVDGNATTTGVYSNSSPYLTQTARVSNVSSTGFTVNVNCKDDNSNLYNNVITVTNGTTKTYTTSLSGNTGNVSKTISVSDFGNSYGTYSITYKTQDNNGNYVTGTLTANVPAPSIPITGVTLNKDKLYLATGCNQTLIATISPSNTTDSKTITWSSSNTGVATVDSTGKVSGVAPGTATITAKTTNNKTASCTVKVYDSIVSDGVWMPGNVQKGVGWGVGGYIYSPTNITQASMTVYDMSMNQLFTYSATPNSKTWSVWDAEDAMKFHTLALGTYKIRLSVENESRQHLNYTHEFTVTNSSATHMNYFNGSPKVTSAAVSNITGEGFDVTISGRDLDSNLQKITIWTWTGDWQAEYKDDEQSKVTTVSGDSGSTNWHVSISDHNYETGQYWISYQIMDQDGNYAWNDLLAQVPETISTDIVRIYRSSRLTESIKVADELKNLLDVGKFTAIVIAKDSDFADALSGSYLATRKNAPILLVNDSNHQEAYQYIRNNLSKNGTIYILGSSTAVSDAFEQGLSADTYNIKRIAGTSRYMTNLDILSEAGLSSRDIFVVTGGGFADSLSCASVGLPILMVDNSKTTLKNSQIKWLTANNIKNIYILGQEASVNTSLAKALKSYGNVTRIGGDSRWITTKMIADEFFPEAEYVTLATGADFADGLIASPLAYALHSPLLMVSSNKTTNAKAYVQDKGVTKAYIIGSKDNISDEAARKILLIHQNVVITER